ncbi:hypothetical protein A2483_01820 [Candidatus Peregrinibacteria bacterium RIFOXYC2_FULL_33_13]|nr:MAG: hypothetical protein UR27_C0001G0029 [Candidatus Peregrinibacteria bacterium GW2011_GWA2_33_10]KKP39759.1 MAG: hypothetical protein UR30_C0008G0028 [Candidatus Peregrinibacteria bacterium GW2011_GWC2_33_13]OGJ50447.1 MAG: hypothetical protein A2229_02500 [Candidatus Peregrinibacteria bacterium RIFOXYA2_FULL_33_7]OGJ52629.1 MAG: hypothetical protein A2483_01820 [Candidatus Peregrinibacteria bacterium RIFOXYC2_FULL_33_13]
MYDKGLKINVQNKLSQILDELEDLIRCSVVYGLPCHENTEKYLDLKKEAKSLGDLENFLQKETEITYEVQEIKDIDGLTKELENLMTSTSRFGGTNHQNTENYETLKMIAIKLGLLDQFVNEEKILLSKIDYSKRVQILCAGLKAKLYNEM